MGLPRAQSLAIRRPRLEAALQRGLSGVLTLVCAPAGSGKSTLVGEWLRNTDLPVAWLSLEDDDSDVTLFIHNLIQSIQSIYPGAALQTLALLRTATNTDAAPLATRLCSELSLLKTPVVIVLDDYHVVRDQVVHQFVSEMLRNLPASVHIVLCTRSDPPLPLARMRVRGQLLEIRGDDLRFTRDESAAMLTRRTGDVLSDSVIDRLVSVTEGWAAGLHLATLSLQGRPVEELATPELAGRASKHIMDFLMDEVLAYQPVEVQGFMMRSAMLDRFSVPLLSEVLGITDTVSLRALLDTLEKGNLFLTPLDDHGEWYRYHQLFRELLRHRCALSTSRAEIAEYFSRASHWFEARGAITEALHYALAAGDRDCASRIVAHNIHIALNTDRRLELRRWVALLPADLIQSSPALTIAEAWLALSSSDFDGVNRLADRVDWLLDHGGEPDPETERVRRAEVAAFRAYHALSDLRPLDCIPYAEKALADLPPDYDYMIGLSWIYYSGAIAMAGDPARARETALERRSNCTPGSVGEMLAITALIGINWLDGDLEGMRQWGALLWEVSKARNNYHIQPYAIMGLGMAAFERNQLEEALSWFAQCPSPERSSNMAVVVDCLIGEALCYLATGKIEEATATLERGHAISSTSHNRMIANALHELEAGIALRRDNLIRAREVASLVTLARPSLLIRSMIPGVSRIRIRMQSAPAYALQQAHEESQELVRQFRSVTTRRGEVQVLALNALVLMRCGEVDGAFATLEESITLGSQRKMLRTWLDLAPEITALFSAYLQWTAGDAQAKVVVRRLLALIESEMESIHTTAQVFVPAVPATNGMGERLTPREQETLAYLSQRLSDKEIARAMVVSTTTVRTHIDNLFAKLGVTDRRAAVERARELGLVLPEPVHEPRS